ncbi:hypothetical protein EW145_g373 [Phellinidium pouzarii]|uniref:RNA polymerase Rpb4/RPC9 core domain-containing protein n=1 Tax=Phellinidium pouzarii TaxID=167371 RepID=A0A4S4LIS9_9AGAM|nr:hypothetical protein EW145_g373 [Phellinidium pouzarii]
MATPRLHRRTQGEEEDASVLRLGPGMGIRSYQMNNSLTKDEHKEFNNAGCLLISEVKYLLENRDKDAPDTAYVCTISLDVPGIRCISIYLTVWSWNTNSVYNKTLEYVKQFAKFTTTDSASAVRETLRREPQLTQFETAQIANLCPADAEESKSIIPSLVKVDDDRLQALLDEIQTMRKFQS